jgi:diguanylate cyclase (GGDEF)-like protein
MPISDIVRRNNSKLGRLRLAQRPLVRVSLLLGWQYLVMGVLGFAGTPSPVEGRNDWRFWQEQQGLADSYVGGLSRDLNGGVWMVHGDISAVTRFDGRDFTVVQSPPLYQRFDSADGKNGWAVDQNGLHRFQDGKWNAFPDSGAFVFSHEAGLRVLDLGNSRAFLLLKDRIVRFGQFPLPASNPANSRVELPPGISKIGGFVSFERALDGAVWIVGRTGAARFHYDGQAGIRGWEIFPLEGGFVYELRTAIACPNGELFVSGIQRPGDKSVALHLWRGKWEVVARQQSSDQTLLAWRDGRGDLWRVEANVLFRQASSFGKPDANKTYGGWERVDTRSQVLTGKIAQVVVNPDGSFFVATSRGLALHMNPAWITFGVVPDSRGRPVELRQWLTSALEDRQNRLWFLGQKSLFRYGGGQWDEFALPGSFQIEQNDPSGLGEIGDGRILVQLFNFPWLAIFDPEKRNFSPVAAPPGYQPIIFSGRPDGKFDVVMVSTTGGADALAVLDRASFGKVSPVPWKWGLNYPRAMLRSRQGDLWLGGTTGLWRMTGGNPETAGYTRVPPGPASDAVDPRSAYALLEEENGQILVGGRKALYRWPVERPGTAGHLELLSEEIDAARKIVQDRSGVTWIASGSGVFRSFRHPGAGSRGVRDWLANDESEGLPSTLVQSILEDSQGRIWAATTRGPALYLPDTDNDPPKAVIRAEDNADEAASSGQFRITFAGRDKWDLTPPDLLLFSHRLDGGSWSRFENTTVATYHGVSEGRHRFEVVALDRQGNIDTVPSRFSMMVAAPWYRTSGFIGIVTLGLAIIGFLVYLAIRHVRQLQEMATRDGLTHDWNRRTIFQLLSAELEQAQRNSGQVTVIMADVDEFKKINDRYGHPIGDLVLREISRRLRATMQTGDKLGRYGGEEFLIVVPDCGKTGAFARAEQLRRAVEREPVSIGGGELTVTCSFGVDWTRDGSYDLQHLLRDADSALYRAKHAGRNRVETSEQSAGSVFAEVRRAIS